VHAQPAPHDTGPPAPPVQQPRRIRLVR
jgi:hypothetical protein